MVMEGVHLSINAVIRIMAKHPCVLPFLVYISNEAKHKERFAVRSSLPVVCAHIHCAESSSLLE